MKAIRSLRPAIDLQEAVRIFAPSGPIGFLSRVRRGPLLAVADVYLPFRLYQVTVDDAQIHKTTWYAVDALSGILDLYEFPRGPASVGLVELTVESRNCPDSRVCEPDTRHLAMDAARRKMFSAGFFRIRKPQISAALLDSEFYVPYWAAFHGSKDVVRIAVIDAVRGRLEGGKASHVIERWLGKNSEGALAGVTAGGMQAQEHHPGEQGNGQGYLQ
jgi:hypothetical protein